MVILYEIILNLKVIKNLLIRIFFLSKLSGGGFEMSDVTTTHPPKSFLPINFKINCKCYIIIYTRLKLLT